MKNQRKQIAVLLASIAILFSSCSKDVENPPPAPEPNVNFTAKIDGADFSADFKLGYFNNGGIGITGISSDNELIEFFITDFNGEGNYVVSLENGIVCGFIPDTSDFNNFFLATGSEETGGVIVVSEWNADDSTLTGTFEFDAVDFLKENTVSVTSGVFTNIDMTGKSPENGDSDMIEVDIDGELFAPKMIVTARNFNQVSITGNTLDFSSSINISFPDTISVGNHPFNFTNQGRYIEGNTVYNGAGGVLTITVNDLETGRIEGEFSFTGTNTTNPDDTKEFTNGAFIILGE